MLQRALSRKTSQADTLTLVVKHVALNVDYYRDRCDELEAELARRLAYDPVSLRILMPLRFRD